MEYLVTAEEMKRYDQNTIEHFGVPAAVLMERAALACCEVILNRQKQLVQNTCEWKHRIGKRVLVLAGGGNNGGDGFAIGRLLMQEGFAVDFFLAGPEEKVSELTALQIASVKAYGGKVRRTLPDGEYDIVVDALLGVGISRELTGIYQEAVEYINRADAFVLAADIPSGIHADTGAVMGTAVHADVTVTFGFRKMGLFLYPGTRHAGKLVCAQIGITPESFLDHFPCHFTFTEPPQKLMPVRPAEGNKGTFGKVLLLAGSEGMAGAAVLAGKGAFAAGCGMVKIVTPVCNRDILQETLPEAMVTADIRESAKWADVVAAGPGLSAGKEAGEQLRWLIENTVQPLLLDADAINLLAADSTLQKRLCRLQNNPGSARKLVLTPHPGELARLQGCSVKEVLADPSGMALTWAKRLQAVVVCKGARTFAAAPDGRIYVNGSGNSGMATAGSGDVLTGIAAALAACEEDIFSAVCVAVYLHGLAGDKAAHMKSEYSMKAGDIADMVPALLLP